MLEILTYPDPRLKEISKSVETFDKELHTLLDQMAETMYAANGVGLAAPQVNRPIRAFVIDLGEQPDMPKQLWEFINPKILDRSGKVVYEEGCLSVPGFTEEVQRSLNISVEFQDRYGQHLKLDAEDVLAVAIQHENDHLDGIVFVERLSPLKRRLAKRKLARL